MPRRRDSDDEDMMRTCPHCGGLGFVHNDPLLQGGETECPICMGKGAVNRRVWNAYAQRNPNGSSSQ